MTLQHLTQKISAVRIIAAAQPLVANQGAAAVSVRGVTFDSLRNKPLAGATVRISGLDESAKSDANGQFELRGVSPGSYVMSLQHPTVDSLGLGDIERGVTVVSDTTNVSLSIPSFATWWGGACVGRSTPRDSAFMYGTIRDANTRDNLPHTRASVSWSDVGIGANKKLNKTRQKVDAVADSLGNYAACGIPVDVALMVTATADAATATILQLGARDA